MEGKIEATIELLQELNMDEAAIIKKLQEKFGITEEETKNLPRSKPTVITRFHYRSESRRRFIKQHIERTPGKSSSSKGLIFQGLSLCGAKWVRIHHFPTAPFIYIYSVIVILLIILSAIFSEIAF